VDGVPFPSVSFNENFFNVGTTTGANVAPSPLNLLSVNDIESIQILKDADATSMYGTRGANGVILINSKQPDVSTKGAVTTVNFYQGIGKATNLVHYLDTKQYLEMRREAFKNDGVDPDPMVDHDLLKWDQNSYTDWQKEMIGGTANITDGSVELKGGSKYFGYRASGLYRQESTVYPSENFKYKKGGGMLQLRFSSKDQKLKMEFSGNYVADRNYLPTTDLTTFSTAPPNTPKVYTDDGKLNFADSTFDNPYAFLLQTSKANSSNFRTYLNTTWEPLKNLMLSADVGGSTFKVDETQIVPARSFVPSMGYSNFGRSYFYGNRYTNGLMDLRASWRKTIGQEQFSILAGARFQFEGQLKTIHRAMEYVGDDETMKDINAGGPVEKLDSTRTDFQNQSYYGRLEYKHADKYLLTLTFNRDGSTRLASRYANFGAVGAAWIFTREGWFGENKVLSFGKFRGSYGITGNDQYVRNFNRSTYVWGMSYYKNGLQQGKFDYSPSYGWEKIRKAELAVDLGFINDQILATFCYYNNRSTDQLLTGRFQTIVRDPSKDIYMPVNVPAIVENTGLEVDLEGVVFRNESLTWSTNLNLSFPKNRLVYFPQLERSGYRSYYSEGLPLDVLMGFHLKGVDPQTGVYQFEDPDNNGPSLSDRKFAKELGPFFYGGWYNHLRYKNFEMSCLLRYTKQNNYSYRYTSGLYPPGAMANQPVAVLDRWRAAGDETSIQRYTASVVSESGTAFGFAQESDQRLSIANYLRLQSLVLAWNLPQKKLLRTKIKSCKLYVQGLNLFTLTGYEGRDPEITAGPDSYPSLRVITAGMQISF
jgi:TonB-linked SusC/RagA family outer membrane protein